ncbi:sulfite exporter TauE/SafE family protein [Microbispora sp. NEAU-D428]|uniref:sulfite exporter TauE/SafE family protein n=1 Tax=Microbispora sitophila TaxID=2771537 RepID=UPI00186673A1|nr:sulfite exporter TauE/SafE family protein [Microbispora sitophila]
MVSYGVLHGRSRLQGRSHRAAIAGRLAGLGLDHRGDPRRRAAARPSPEAFKAIVPVLITLALVLVVAGPAINRRLAARHASRGHKPRLTLLWATAGAGTYGGYFGAAQGVLLMGLLGALHGGDVQRNNAVKNLLTGAVNLVAAVVFVTIAALPDVALIATGSALGGVIGARVGRRLPPWVLRGLIVVVGIVAIVKLLASCPRAGHLARGRRRR